MKDKIERTIEWYKWLLKFHPIKYIGIAIMLFCPLILIYRFIFLGSSQVELIAGCLVSLVLGSFVWSIGWDPYG